MSDILNKIVAVKHEEIAAAKKKKSSKKDKKDKKYQLNKLSNFLDFSALV